MELPKHHPVEKLKLKNCRYMDCNKEFFGRPIQKYCEFHMDPHHRKRIRPKAEDPGVRNMVLFHAFTDTTTAHFHCALDGCGEPFEIKLYPRQTVYPKYCEKHRSEFQRAYFERNRRLKVAC